MGCGRQTISANKSIRTQNASLCTVISECGSKGERDAFPYVAMSFPSPTLSCPTFILRNRDRTYFLDIWTAGSHATLPTYCFMKSTRAITRPTDNSVNRKRSKDIQDEVKLRGRVPVYVLRNMLNIYYPRGSWHTHTHTTGSIRASRRIGIIPSISDGDSMEIQRANSFRGMARHTELFIINRINLQHDPIVDKTVIERHSRLTKICSILYPITISILDKGAPKVAISLKSLVVMTILT